MAAGDYAALLAAPDRDPDDRVLDAQRRPAELLAFAGVRPGMRVAELAAAGGYTTELLARAVGPEGRVYGQNSKFILERFAEGPWSQRLEKPALSNVERLDRDFETPFPEGVGDLDAVLIVLFYHDLVWFESDRASVNRAVLEALKPGGAYVVVDHSARPGDGVSQAQSRHRIEQSVVQSEVEAAGFVLDAAGDFLRNADDTRDWNAAPRASGERRGQSDRFALRFVKPR
jgi:predicted methyltransferase